jgi:gamma-glutamylputrescine oxidase
MAENPVTPLPKQAFYWQERTPLPPLDSLRGRVACDALVVGGGITGLTAAGLLKDAGADVILLEAVSCGFGATGKSSGFITPDSELQVEQLVRRFGDEEARRIWKVGMEACDEIRRTAESLPGRADLQDADCLFVATDAAGERKVAEEHAARQRLGLDSTLYSGYSLPEILGGRGFNQGVRYGNTFSIDPYGYAAGLREHLRARGVRLYERSPVQTLGEGSATTPFGEVLAHEIYLCLDRAASEIGVARRDTSSAQTYLLLSDPLPEKTLARLFPAGPLMVWDSELVYSYFRTTPDRRVLAGGSNLNETYRKAPWRPQLVREQIARYLRDRIDFPADATFTHFWPGRIGVTKDFLPLAGRSPRFDRHFWALCGAGLPWSVVAARTAVDSAHGRRPSLAGVLDPRRGFSEAEVLQPLLGKRATFALSHYAHKEHETPVAALPRRKRIFRAGLVAAAAALIAAVWRRRGRR